MKPAHLHTIPLSRKTADQVGSLLLGSSYPEAKGADLSRNQHLEAAPPQSHQQSLHQAQKPVQSCYRQSLLPHLMTSKHQATPGRSPKVTVTRFMCLPASTLNIFILLQNENKPCLICQLLRLLLSVDDSCHPVTQEKYKIRKHGTNDFR